MDERLIILATILLIPFITMALTPIIWNKELRRNWLGWTLCWEILFLAVVIWRIAT